MNVAPLHGELVWVTAGNRAGLSRSAKAGRAMRLAPGLYALGARLPPEQVARHHLYAVIAQLWPGGVLCGRTAIAGGVPVDGVVYVAHPDPPRRSALTIPGVEIVPVEAPGPLPGDVAMPSGLSMSGPARLLVENVDTVGRPSRFRAGLAAVEDRIDALARTGGAGRLTATLEQLDVIAASYAPGAVEVVRRHLLALLGTFQHGSGRPQPRRLAARMSGEPYDSHRVEMLERFVAVAEQRPPRASPALPPESRWEWLAFFEAYFSNFIEGTEFGVDEARDIAVHGLMPSERPQDAHDVSATYRLAADRIDRAAVPRTGDELVELLRSRHSILMAARPDKRPGEFKTRPNFAGGYQFVDPALVVGTLTQGLVIVQRLANPLARAAAMMVLVTECHPFDDGNGRVARLTSNAELSRAGEVRLIVPTVFRNDYLAALSGLSNGAGNGESLLAVLEFAQRWSAAIDWTTYDDADSTLVTCNAYVDPGLADRTGIRLTMPD